MASLDRLKPAGSIRLRLLLAALTWTAVGIALVWVGSGWVMTIGGWTHWVGLAAGLALGLVKARLVLGRVAGNNARRIVAAGEGRCVGGYLSWPAWLLVLAMMLFGATLRSLPLPRLWLGMVYVTAGAGLLAGSSVSWRRWLAFRRAFRDRPPA
jgi:hypothetical protein